MDNRLLYARARINHAVTPPLKFLIAGAYTGGAVAVSPDDVSWTFDPGMDELSPSYLNGVAYDDVHKTYIVSGDHSAIATSTDLLSWTARTSNSSNSGSMNNCICSHGGTTIAAFSDSTTKITTVVRSTDGGLTWTVVLSQGNFGAIDIVYAGGKFVIADRLVNGYIVTSSNDGVSWSAPYTIPGFGRISRLFSDGTNLIAASLFSALVYKSSTGLSGSWTDCTAGGQLPIGGGGNTIAGFVYVAPYWYLNLADGNGIWRSSDLGATWTQWSTQSVDVGVADLNVYADGFVSATNGDQLALSPDMVTWTLGDPLPFITNIVFGVIPTS